VISATSRPKRGVSDVTTGGLKDLQLPGAPAHHRRYQSKQGALMAIAPPDPHTDPDATIDGERSITAPYRSDDPEMENSPRPRLIEEHHVIGPHGEDELEATDERGRRWYQLRPEPRRRADLIGFNYMWWIAIWFVFIMIVFLPWGRGWGY
jgi:hypothetical protein